MLPLTALPAEKSPSIQYWAAESTDPRPYFSMHSGGRLTKGVVASNGHAKVAPGQEGIGHIHACGNGEAFSGRYPTQVQVPRWTSSSCGAKLDR